MSCLLGSSQELEELVVREGLYLVGPIYWDRDFLHRGEWDKSIGDAPVEEGSQDAVVILGCPGRGRARHAGITPAPTRFLVTVLDVLHEESERVGIALVVLLLLHKLQ